MSIEVIDLTRAAPTVYGAPDDNGLRWRELGGQSIRLNPAPDPPDLFILKRASAPGRAMVDRGDGTTLQVLSVIGRGRYLQVDVEMGVVWRVPDTPPADFGPGATQSYVLVLHRIDTGVNIVLPFITDRPKPAADEYQLPISSADWAALGLPLGNLWVCIVDTRVPGVDPRRMLRIVPWRAPAPAGATTWRTVNGDVLDEICQRHYGRTDVVGAVLDANPGLAALPPILPAGVTIVLPPPPAPPPARAFRLWDLP